MMVEYQILERLKRIENSLDNINQKKWLDINGAIKYLDCGKSTISRAIKRGELKVSKQLGKRMFKSEWLDSFLEK